jgi:hypothetical protein
MNVVAMVGWHNECAYSYQAKSNDFAIVVTVIDCLYWLYGCMN